MRIHLPKLITALALTQAAGLVGSLFTVASVRDWYPTLVKPALNPPSWVFGPVWTVLYLMMGVALYLVWTRHIGGRKRVWWLRLFIIHLGVNALWSILFFGRHMLFGALVDIAVLWTMILALIILALRFSRSAAYLLLPYLAWVSFASYLNWSLWQRNQ